MSKICYMEKSFTPAHLALIDQANEIIEDYQAQGFDLTLRQLYYQFVSRDLLANKQTEYKRLGGIISDGRLAGLIDWNAIEDRTRSLKGNQHWTDPAEIVRACIRGYRIDKWLNQAYRVEVWIEKEALVGVISGPCQKLDIDYFACKGYNSQSNMWAAAQRLKGYLDDGQTPVIVHLGDHDPSGIDMTRDIHDRVMILSGGHSIEVVRIALNMDQVEQYNPPPNPAKLTDSRCQDYIARYGSSSWELDALEPSVIGKLITDTVNKYRDPDDWDAAVARENSERSKLTGLADNLED